MKLILKILSMFKLTIQFNDAILANKATLEYIAWI